MVGRTIEIPDFDFSGFYYPQILESLIRYKRRNVPELTDESDQEPTIQLLRAFALVGHLSNVLLDVVANESTLPTAQLATTVRNQLRAINYTLRPAVPAQADVVYRLSRTFSSGPNEIVSEASQVATDSATGDTEIIFESLAAVEIGRTDQIGACYVSDGGVYSDFTSQAIANTAFVPFGAMDEGDAIYFGHADVMWDKLNAVVNIAGSNYVGIWEYYSGDLDAAKPDSVSNIGGGQIQFVVNSLLGEENRQSAVIRVRSLLTGTSETVTTAWNGTQNIATTQLLSQSDPSLSPEDYSIGSEWTELDSTNFGTIDGTKVASTSFAQTGDLSFTLPQSELADWKKTTVNGFEGFFIRWRVVTITGATSPTLGRIRIDTGKQYVAARNATQGETMVEEPLGSSNGEPNQRFITSQNHFIQDSDVVDVDGEDWTRVSNFLSSRGQDKHYVVEIGDNDRATIVFGDGVSGKIPDIGAGNISVEYRYGANNNGNVGARKLNVDKTGLTYVDQVFNPRQATGWAEAQGNSEASLERAKIEGPATLVKRDVAVSPDDLSELATSYVDANGASPFSRSRPFEEGFGPKTIELVLVARGGGVPSSSQLTEIQEYFNGDKYAIPPKRKRVVANQQIVATAFQPKLIDVVAVVVAPSSVTPQAIENRLNQVIQPEALKEDGVTYEWNFGVYVPASRIQHEIFKTSESIIKVTLTSPSADVTLGPRELPKIGSVSISIVQP